MTRKRFKIFNFFPELIAFYQIGKEQKRICKINGQPVVFMKQSHSDKVGIIKNINLQSEIDCDALVTREKGICLAVKFADCVPGFLFEPKAKIIAVFHSGWRGTLADIAGNTICKIAEQGGNPAEIIAALGPAICRDCYEIKTERLKLFYKRYQNLILNKDNKLDLGQLVADQLIMAGVKKENIEKSKVCPCCGLENLYSFRKGDKDGRNFGFIGIKKK